MKNRLKAISELAPLPESVEDDLSIIEFEGNWYCYYSEVEDDYDPGNWNSKQ